MDDEDVCEPLCPNLERSKISAEISAKREEASSGLLLSAEHLQATRLLPVDSEQRSACTALLSAEEFWASRIKPCTDISAENQQFAGDSIRQRHVGISSSDRKRLDERISHEMCIHGCLQADASKEETLGDVHSQMHAKTTLDGDVECTSQHITSVHESGAPQQGSAPVNEDNGKMPEMKQDAVMHASQQINAFASVDSSMMPGILNDAVHFSQDEQVDVAPKGIPTHLDDVQQAGGTDLVHDPVDFMMEEGNQGEASLEMLSVAVESIENMQRESEEGSGGAGRVVERTVTGKEIMGHDIEHDAVDNKHHLNLANCGIKSSVKKSMGDSEDNRSFIFDSNSALGEEFQNKDHFLNLLCELAAVQQQDQELSIKRSHQVTSCAASLVKNEASGETRRLSFVDLLRKQMAQAGKLTELTADAFYEQFLRQNHAILGSTLGRDFNSSLPSTGISSNDGAVAALEAEQISNNNSDREGDTPSNDEIMGDSRNGEVEDQIGDLLVKGGRSTGDDEKEEVRGEEKKFGVGDLVWAKVKSHPWWPGQIFNTADASAAAKKIQRPGRSLVAFFGDGTFGWLQQSQLIAFRPNFEEKVKQTTMKSFCRAVAEALNEVSKRTELGLRCSHSSDAMYSADVFPDLNAGMRTGVRIKRHQDIKMSRERFEPKRILEFVQTAARSPCYTLSSGLEYSESCGHVYGFRNFMLSPKKPKIKIVPQNVLKVQNKLKPVQSSSLKRRLGLDEAGGPSTVQGKEAKRLHLSKDVMKKEQQAGNKVQSPKFRTIENLLLTEAEETKVPAKSPEHAKGSTWLAKGKRLQVSPDRKEGKRVKGWHSLGPLGDLADSGAADNLTSADDDSKTLLDITGLRSLKRKKKGGTSKSTTDIVSKEVEQQPVEARKELASNEFVSKMEKIWEEAGTFPDSSTSSLSTVVPDHNHSVLQMTKDFDSAEECDNSKEELLEVKVDVAEETEKDNTELLDLKVGDADKIEKDKGDPKVGDGEGIVEDEGDLKVGDGEGIEEDEGELQNLRDTDAEEHEKNKGEQPDLKVGDAKESEKDEGKPLDAMESESFLQDSIDHDNSLKRKKTQTKHLHSHSQEHEKDKGEPPDLKVGDAEECAKESESLLQDANVHDKILKRKKQTKRLQSHCQEHEKDKGELSDLKTGKVKESEKDKEKTLGVKESESLLQDANDHDNISKRKKKHSKRLHSEEGDTLSLHVKAKKRKQDTHQEGEKKPSSSPKSEHVGSKTPAKSSKLGASIKKVADTLKSTPASLKLANNLSAKKAVSAARVESDVKKHAKSPSLNQSPAFKYLADEHLNSSFAKLLNNLQAVARDPLSSANMKGSLHGVMYTFLKFRSMVFVKSSGYGTAGAGKLMSSHGNGHLSGDKKVDDKGKQNLPLKRQKSLVTDSSEERKSIMKVEPPSESVGPGSQRHGVQDSLSELKDEAMKRPQPLSAAFGSQKSDVQNATIDVETASGETPKSLIGGSLKLGVQELAVAARKKKSEVLKECAAKVQVKTDVLKVQNSFKEKADKEKFTDAKHHAKSVKHHISRAEALSLPERKSPMYNSADVKVARTSLGVFMQFPEDFTLPSEAQLKEIFNPFGTLEPGGARVYRNASTAQVVFKHSTDAEAAWQHAKKNRMFGHVNVSYRLRHFTLSSKSDFEVASAKNGLSAEAFDVKSPLVENHGKPHHSRSSLASGAEQQGGLTEAVHSPARSSPLRRVVEPMDCRVSARSPVRSTSLSKAEPVHSPSRSRAEAGGTIVPEPSPLPNFSHSRAEPAASIVPAPVGNCSSSAELGGSTLSAYPSVFQSQEALPSLSTHVPLHSNLFNPPSVSNVNVSSAGDIQDEMLRLLQQVSVIVSSSTLTLRST